MTFSELKSLTVVQLRKLAREQSIVLAAGMDKASIVHAIAAGMDLADEPVESSSVKPVSPPDQEVVSPTDSAAEETDKAAIISAAGAEDADSETAAEPFSIPDAEEASTEKEEEPSEPRFQAAWHSPDSPQAPSSHTWPQGNIRPSWQNTPQPGRPLGLEQRSVPLRPHAFGPRFGPASSAPAQESPSIPVDPQIRSAASPLPEHRVGFVGTGAFSPRPSTPSVSTAVPAAPIESAEESVSSADASSISPTLEELLATGDFEEGSGILELHPDGYGFLRAANFLPSSRDIYVSLAQIRRFSLRTGDLIKGKIRPQREGDKYAALLYIDSVNGLSEDEALRRPLFDELTPVYPDRKISLETKEGEACPSLRLIDLIAPLGFGQRALLLCPPDTGKRELLADYAKIITRNYPDAHVLTLLIDMTPEDVTAFRESVPCPVLASTFDQAPEAHLRLTEMVSERAMRLVEQKQDVVILADSLTRLAKIYTTAAVQQGRSVPGMVNPSSLLRAKRLFGAARSLKEGGSLTVIATMDIQTGNRVDDSIVEEFKGTANMELTLDQAAARAGIKPSVNLQNSFTKNSDILLNDQQKEGLTLIRQMLGSVSSVTAIPQLLSMMEKAPTNSDLLLKIKDWYALMSKAKR